MIHSFYFNLFFAFYVFVFSSTVSAQTLHRQLEFVELKTPENEPFWRQGQEFSRLAFEGIEAGKLIPYFFDFKTDVKPTLLDNTNWKETLIIDSEETGGFEGVYYAFAQDFTVIALDVSVVKTKKQQIRSIEYVHFYLNEYESNSKEIEYRFSLSWQDLLAYLYAQNTLYYTMSKGLWWQGDIFITQNDYAIDMGTCEQFIVASKPKQIVAQDYYLPDSVFDLTSYQQI